jgi:ligand-binding sensor domain-containing protein
LLAAVACGTAICPVCARPEAFPQLISTETDKRAALPDGARRPAAMLDDVDKTKLPPGTKVLSTAKAASGRVWLLTDHGAFRSTTGGYEPLGIGPRQREPGQPDVRSDARITALAADPIGHIWVGTERGVYQSDGEQWWHELRGRDGVPYERITCLHIAPRGDVWAGTPEGAWRMQDGRFR